jgi:predicted RNA-binding Zn-ribbon protein involved in translation (DUF1610 family)
MDSRHDGTGAGRVSVGRRCPLFVATADARCFREANHTGLCEPEAPVAIPMILWCPSCGRRHIDAGEFARKVHHTHACQTCGMVWRPAVVPTVGVLYLPGFHDDTFTPAFTVGPGRTAAMMVRE